MYELNNTFDDTKLILPKSAQRDDMKTMAVSGGCFSSSNSTMSSIQLLIFLIPALVLLTPVTKTFKVRVSFSSLVI